MARPLRIEYNGAVYNVTAQGNEKKPIFKDDKDGKIYFDALQKAEDRYYLQADKLINEECQD